VLGIRYDWNSRTGVFLHNFGEKPCAVRLRVDGPDGGTLVNLLDQSDIHADESGRHAIELEPYGYRWFRAGALNRVSSGEAP
jgi:maltose alpha-D-glucosyltransferase / alpha-amylase